MPTHLARTALLDFDDPRIARLIAERRWQGLDAWSAIGAAYTFVRDEIPFGYNRSDDLRASQVLADGYGQCNTKATLLMALLRALGVACRLHGFTIDKALQRGAIPPLVYRLSPQSILHSWVEVHLDGRWVELEGFILDARYLDGVRARFPDVEGAFCGYGVATTSLADPQIDWCGRSTYIQREGIDADLGLFDSPDAFYAARGTNLSGPRRWLYRFVIRHWMNRRVARIRALASRGVGVGSPVGLTLH